MTHRDRPAGLEEVELQQLAGQAGIAAQETIDLVAEGIPSCLGLANRVRLRTPPDATG